MHKFLSESNESYDSSVFDLVRFIRNLYQHIIKRKKDRSRESVRVCMIVKILEHEVTQLFPELLLDITRVLSSVYYVQI